MKKDVDFSAEILYAISTMKPESWQQCPFDISVVNQYELDTAWKRMTDEKFKRLVQDKIRSLEERAALLKQFCS